MLDKICKLIPSTSYSKKKKEGSELYSLLYLFAGGKMEALEHMTDNYCFYAIGDGAHAQTFVVLKGLFGEKADVFSIDPEIKNPDGKYTFKSKIQDFERPGGPSSTKIPVLILQHAHVYIAECLPKFVHNEKVIVLSKWTANPPKK